MEVFAGNPFIVGGRVSFPSHEVLLLFPSSEGSFFDDLIDFPFWLAFYDFWWQFQEVGAVLFGFLVWCEQGSMEDVVDFPIWGEFKFVGYL